MDTPVVPPTPPQPAAPLIPQVPLAQPPAPPPAPAPLPTPPSPVASPSPLTAPLPDPEPENPLAALSPAAVLARRSSAGLPPSSATAPAPLSPSREELLRQAATAPRSPLILPTELPREPEVHQSRLLTQQVVGLAGEEPQAPDASPPKAPDLTSIKLGSRADMAEEGGPAVDARATMAEAPIQVEMALPKRRNPNDGPEPAARITSARVAVPGAIAGLPSASPASSHRRNIGLISAIGGVVALILLAGVGFLLGAQGVRVPVFYQMVTKLQPNGVREAASALRVVTAHQKYSYADGSEIAVGLQGGSTKPLLPDSTSTSPVVTPISTLAATVQDGTRTTSDDSFSGTLSVVADHGSGVTLQIAGVKETGGILWQVRLPLNKTPTIHAINTAPINETLLTSLLHPAPLRTVLAAVSKENSYAKKTVNGQQLAVYVYTLKPQALTGLLPTNVSFSTATAEVTYAWKTGLPTQVNLVGAFRFQNQQYSYRNTALYGNWDTAAPAAVGEVASAQNPAVLPTGEFVAQLGLTPKALPGLDPAAAAALPTELPAITPTGNTVTAVSAPITTVPPLLTQPASAEAKARDVQRRHDLADLQTALERYKTVVGGYPKVQPFEQTGSSATLLKELVPRFLTAVPVDPTSTTFWYEYSSDGNTYLLRAVAEDASRPEVKQGTSFSYYELTNTK